MMFNVFDAYWIVGGDADHVWSSARQGSYLLNDPTYQAWLTAGNLPRRIGGYDELYGVLLYRAPTIAALVAADWLQKGYLSPQQGFEYLMGAGLQVTSTSNSGLNGLYDVSLAAQNRLSSIVTGINAGAGIPGGGAAFGYMDMTGAVHEFTADEFVKIGEAIESYVYQLYITEGVMLNGGKTSWPSPTAKID